MYQNMKEEEIVYISLCVLLFSSRTPEVKMQVRALVIVLSMTILMQRSSHVHVLFAKGCNGKSSMSLMSEDNIL